MFSSKMQETQTGIIKMKETSPDAIRALIHYLHVHKIEYPNETAFELYSLTDKYEILDLKVSLNLLHVFNDFINNIIFIRN
jgi:hypothetical protein